MAKNVANLYADLAEPGDLAAQQLVADLHAFFHVAVPSRLRVAPPLPAPRPRTAWPKWPRLAAVGAVAIFALAGATYVVLAIMQSLWVDEAGLRHVTRAGLVRDLDLSQTVGGVTVRLHKGYADAVRIAVGYTVELGPGTGADGADSIWVVPVLTDDAGRTYRGNVLLTTASAPLGAQVYNFEGPVVTDAREINFTLTIPEVTTACAVPSPAPCKAQAYSGPWVFRFTLPIHPGKVVEPDLTLTRDDLSVTITRIVVAPSMVRYDYRITVDGQPTDGDLHTSIRRERGLVEGSVIGYRSMLDRPQCPEGQCTSMISVPLFESDALTIERVWVVVGLGTERYRMVEIEGPFVIPLR